MLTSNDQSLDIPQENMEVTNSLLEPTDLIPLDIVTMDKIDDVLQDNEDTKYLMIDESSSEYTLEFETPAPYAIEEDNSDEDMFNKTVTVTHDSALHYTDIQSYSEIPEDLVTEDGEFNLYWNINGTITDVTFDPRFQVEYIDTDDNGIVDHIQWNVPQLSQQIFQIIASKKTSHNGINVRISLSSDDAEQLTNGNMDLDDKSDLDIAENHVGLRFQNISIPPGATITKAYIQFTVEKDEEKYDGKDGKKDSASVIIFAENVANAETFSKSESDITNRETTDASVNWSIHEWKKHKNHGKEQKTPDISSLVQEVINKNNWSKGNSIAFMLLINNPGDRDALTYDGNPKKSARLHIEFFDNPTCDDDDEDNDSNHDDRKEALALKDKLEDDNEKDDFDCPISHEIKFFEKLEFENDKVETSKRTALKQELIETLHLDDRADTSRDLTINLDETLHLDDRADATKTRVFTETFTEKLTLQDPRFITRVNGAIQIDLDETLHLDDRADATKTRVFTETFTEKLTLQDTSFITRVNGAIHLDLDETLDLDDRADATKTRAFTEELTLQDTSFITRVNGAIHLDLDETLDLDDRADTSRDLTVQLDETLDLDDRADTSRDL